MNVSQTSQAGAGSRGALRFTAFTVAAAVTAAVAALASTSLELPVWAMFIGWVGYFTRVGTWRTGIANYACLVLGLALGIGAAFAIQLLQPVAGVAALPAVVFAVASIVVSMRVAPPINNLLCYFLGLIAFFAAHLPPTLATWIHLAGAMALGGSAAAISTCLQARTGT